MILVCDEKGRAIKRGPLYTRLGSFRTRQAAVEKLEELGMSEYCSCCANLGILKSLKSKLNVKCKQITVYGFCDKSMQLSTAALLMRFLASIHLHRLTWHRNSGFQHQRRLKLQSSGR